MNTWPGGGRKALNQSVHNWWNANHYPGTRQLCSICQQPTDRCEEDMLTVSDNYGRGENDPLCETCYEIVKPGGGIHCIRTGLSSPRMPGA